MQDNKVFKILNQYIIVVLAIISIGLSFFLPQKILNAKNNSCLMQLIFNKPCPVCGMTRTFIALGHFNFAKAIQFNLAGIFWFFFLIVYILLKIGILLKLIQDSKIIYNIIYYASLFLSGFTLLYWIARLFFL